MRERDTIPNPDTFSGLPLAASARPYRIVDNGIQVGLSEVPTGSGEGISEFWAAVNVPGANNLKSKVGNKEGTVILICDPRIATVIAEGLKKSGFTED